MPGQMRDAAGVAKYRHEAVGAVLQVRPAGDALALHVLIYRRPRPPYEGRPALPSGPVEVTETIDQSVLRHLRVRTAVDRVSHLEQLGTRSEPGRDPNERTIATSYLGLLPWPADPALAPGAAWLPVDEVPDLAFDHARLLAEAVARLRAKLSYTNIGFAMAAEDFTIAELRDCYAAALGYAVSATNLQRVLQRRGQLEPTGVLAGPGARGGRPARRFRFSCHALTVTDPSAVLRPE